MSEQSLGKLSINSKYFSFMTTKPETLQTNVANCITLKEKHFFPFAWLLRTLKYRAGYICHSLLE